MNWNGIDFMEGFQIPTLVIGFQNHQTWDLKDSLGFQNPQIPNAMAYQTRKWNGFKFQVQFLYLLSQKI